MAVIKSKNGILNAIRRFAPSECHFGRGRLSLVSAVVGVPRFATLIKPLTVNRQLATCSLAFVSIVSSDPQLVT